MAHYDAFMSKNFLNLSEAKEVEGILIS